MSEDDVLAIMQGIQRLAERLRALERRIDYLETADHITSWDCADCGVDIFDLGEDFYVHDDLWQTYGAKGHHVLCIGCLEARMGRQLTRDDFKSDGSWAEGHPDFPDYRRSARLMSRVAAVT